MDWFIERAEGETGGRIYIRSFDAQKGKNKSQN